MSGNLRRIVLAALRGGSGKTLVSMGLIGAWRSQGLNVAPFKKGPDFIDAAWLSRAAAHECHHLDTFLLTPDCVLESFLTGAAGADIAVVEGNRGLCDGVDLQGSHSTAALARLLQAPVVLIVDCSKVTRTVAAMILGCLKMEPDLEVKGVILNRVARSRHEDIIAESIRQYCGLPTLGAVPKLQDIPLPERHLGLIPPQENGRAADMALHAAAVAKKHLDLDALWLFAKSATNLALPAAAGLRKAYPATSVTIGVVRDSAFQFYYPENIEALKSRGARIVEISALADSGLPPVNALYIGGGFPETHAERLAANQSFRASLLQAIERGLPVYAECGGAMYLGRDLKWRDKTFPMVGAYPVSFGWSLTPQAHGYTVLNTKNLNPFFRVGVTLKGHEFHYSHVADLDTEDLTFAFSVERGVGFGGNRDGICRRNLLATYSHLHALGSPEWSAALVDAAAFYKQTSNESKTLTSEEGTASKKDSLEGVTPNRHFI